jgi:hypothetical protein
MIFLPFFLYKINNIIKFLKLKDRFKIKMENNKSKSLGSGNTQTRENITGFTLKSMPFPFANNGDKNNIPISNDTENGAASFNKGFPEETSKPDGVPPDRKDFNGILYDLSNNISYLQRGGIYTFDKTVSDAIGGYAKDAVLGYINNGKLYKLISLIDKNIYDFNEDSSYIGEYWGYADNGTSIHIGTVFSYISKRPPAGAYLLNGQTIENCQSEYPQFYNWLVENAGLNNIRTVTASQFNQEVAEFGACGGFVIDTNAGSVRLPDLRNAFIQGADGSSIGQTMGAGLPNITGQTSNVHDNLVDSNTDRGAFSAISKEVPAWGSAISAAKLTFDASLSNPIYGNSNTVQPLSAKYSICIQIYNVATELSTQESAQLSSQMQMKAQTDLANVTDKLSDNFLEKIIPDYTAGIDIDFPLSATPYTAPCNGVYVVNFYVNFTTTYLYINNIRSAYSQHSSQESRDSSSITINLKKGDTIYWDLNYSRLYSSTFYPLKGAN